MIETTNKVHEDYEDVVCSLRKSDKLVEKLRVEKDTLERQFAEIRKDLEEKQSALSFVEGEMERMRFRISEHEALQTKYNKELRELREAARSEQALQEEVSKELEISSRKHWLKEERRYVSWSVKSRKQSSELIV